MWERPGLSKRDRSLVTVSALVALYRGEQLNFHLQYAMDNGLTEAEMVEALTHLAFYAGWPNAMDASAMASSGMPACLAAASVMARSRNGTPSRSATRGPTVLPPAPYRLASVTTGGC